MSAVCKNFKFNLMKETRAASPERAKGVSLPQIDR